MDLTEPIAPENFQVVKDLIRSDQVPPSRVYSLLAENPQFSIWMQGK